ncbi:MAG: RagB/SusD family nutrient uptake outer membrane protein [Chryseolinea sp.]
MRKFNIKAGIVLGLVLVLTNSCSDSFLEVTPNGALDQKVLATKDGVNALLIGAYAMIDGVSGNGFGWEAASSNWVYGSIRGLEANKGTDAGDQPDINPIQKYTETATNPYLSVKWGSIYDAIARVNQVLNVLAVAEADGAISAEDADSFRRQARTLRGFYHLEAYKLWVKIPYVDETTNLDEVTNADSEQTVNVDKIIADLDAGTTLPNDMDQIGRFNGTVAKVLKAKALMQMKKDYTGAKTLLADVITNGKDSEGNEIGFEPKYGDIFDTEKRNGVEAIYTVQYSVNDGSGGWNGGWGEVLNFPYKSGASPGGCCGFFIPSGDLVNSFKTKPDGLPYLDNTYNNAPLKNDQGLTPKQAFTPDGATPLDPRLDWTVGRRGIPYLDWGVHTGSDWIRDQSYSGPYSPKKQVYKKSQEGKLTEVGNWTSGWTANGYRLIRYADVVLLLAECQIETNDLAAARSNVNRVRGRATNPDGFVKNADESGPAANYVISIYPTGGASDPFSSQASARVALMMERKLELGMEGHRFFDLQRWGVVQSELNRILTTYEGGIRSGLYGIGVTVGPEDVTFPIPQGQIDRMKGRLEQNR